MSFPRRRRLLPFLLLLPAMLAPAPTRAARDEAPQEPPAAEAAKEKKAAADVPAELPARHREFLELVAPLMSERERQVFLLLRQDYQRDAFVRRFWQVRDPFPQTPGNELEERWQERVRLARDRFRDLSDDRARLLLFNGEARSTLQGRCPGLLLPLEIWFYRNSEFVRGDFTLVFYSPSASPSGPFRIWRPSQGLDPILSIEARVRLPDGDLPQAIAEGCQRGDDILGGLAGAVEWDRIEAAVLPKVSEEWLQTFVSYSTDLPAGAPAFPAQLDISYPGRHQSRTVVQGLLSIPREEAQVTRLKDFSSYNFLVDGEVVRGEELFEHFRYRFTLPEEEVRAGSIPLVFQRHLRPGVYTLILKVEDVAAKRFFRDERRLEVPAQIEETAEQPVEQSGGQIAGAPGTITADGVAPPAGGTPGPGGSAVSDALAEANAPLRNAHQGEQTLRILAPPQELLTGRARVEALVTGEGIARVSFLLDGKPVLSKASPPYSVELNLGNQPRVHSVLAVATGAGGQELARDEVLLNAGPHRFSVRLVEPQPGKAYRQSVRAQAEIEVPEGEKLDRVEFFLNERLIATLYQAPFVQPILIPDGGNATFVRTVAYLDGGSATEDVVLVNAPEGARVQVDLVELYTTVVDRRGRPVAGLARGDFRVFEDGAEQQVNRFELVRDLPIYAGILLDTSASMTEELPDAVRGALRFFETVITPKDRAAVITFNDKPTLAVRFTSNSEVLAGGLSNVVAEGNTSLYDSLIYAFYYFGGIRGRRAIVLLSDGRDEGSRYQYDDVLEYARRSGVTIYAVGINLTTKDADVRLKLQGLAEESGGRTFFVQRAGELQGVYKAIEEELRTQYLLVYESTQSGKGEKFRAVEVKVGKPGLDAKTLRGYYP